jgi:sugar O-acyltransferase (sialic acid O-acetyltransferase NeuD family)
VPDRLIIVGCGGFGREVLGIAAACQRAGLPLTVAGFVDDAPSDHDLSALHRLKTPYLGPVTPADSSSDEFAFIVAIGSSTARRRVVHRLGPAARHAVLVHPDSTIGPGVDVGPGSVIAPGVRLSTNIRVGSHVHLDQNATVGHDSVIGDFARLNPSACVSGAVSVGAGALIGANATVLQGLTIGRDTTVGAGAVVTRNVAENAVVRGVPAR